MNVLLNSAYMGNVGKTHSQNIQERVLNNLCNIGIFVSFALVSSTLIFVSVDMRWHSLIFCVCYCQQRKYMAVVFEWVFKINKIFNNSQFNDSTLQWRHNKRDGVSNHRCRGCLLNSLFRRRSKKTLKLVLWGESTGDRRIPLTNGQ